MISTARGTGSGFLVTAGGYLVTNAHVVDDGDEMGVTLRDGRSLIGATVSRHESYDLALVKVEGAGFPVLPLGGLADVEVGNDVIALGTPLGQDWSLTKGIVSATRRYQNGWLIQTDAAINRATTASL